jgi:hypothetical protein
MRGGKDNPLTLLPATADAVWQLNIADNTVQDVEHVAVSNSNASLNSTIVANNSTDLGGNINWNFLSVVVGETITWMGTIDNQWSNIENWSLGRTPANTDVVVVPAGVSSMPLLLVPVVLNSLTIAEGAELSLNGCDLTVTNTLIAAGELVAKATETVTLNGNAVFGNNSMRAARSTLLVDGHEAQMIDLGGSSFARVKVTRSGGEVTINGGAQIEELIITAIDETPFTCRFAAGKEIKVGRFIATGDRSVANLSLCSVTPGAAWGLKATGYARVIGAMVSDSNAGSGMTVPAFDSLDKEGNSNWDFTAKSGIWSGGGVAGKFDDANNWASGSVPDSETHVLLDNVATVNITAAANIASLTVGGNGTAVALNASAPLTVAGTMMLLDQSTTSLSKPVVVNNSVLLGAGATLTHAANDADEANKLFLTVAEEMVIEDGALIDVRLKGNAAGKGYSPPVTGHAPSHGGLGRNMNPGEGQFCYGSIASPTNISSGSAYDRGCGAVRLNVGGTLRHDGVIMADGLGGSGGNIPNYYSGTGGSVWITAADLVGGGSITANAGNYLVNYPGGAGRIALVLTKADSFDNFSGMVAARGGKDVSSLTDKVPASGAGTIYRRTASERFNRGTVLIDNAGGLNATINCTDIPPATFCDPNEFQRFTFAVANGGTLRLRGDCTVGDVQIMDSNSRLNLNSYTLTIRSREHPFPTGTVINYGKIIWDPLPSTTVLILK